MTTDETKTYPPPNETQPQDRPQDLPEGAQVFVGEDQLRFLEEQNKSKIKLPALPQGVLEWTDEEQKNLIFSNQPDADLEDVVRRLQFKLGWIWQDWDTIRNNQKLVDAINNVAKDPESEEHFLKQILVLFIDRLGKVLGQTPIVQELTWKPPTDL